MPKVTTPPSITSRGISNQQVLILRTLELKCNPITHSKSRPVLTNLNNNVTPISSINNPKYKITLHRSRNNIDSNNISITNSKTKHNSINTSISKFHRTKTFNRSIFSFQRLLSINSKSNSLNTLTFNLSSKHLTKVLYHQLHRYHIHSNMFPNPQFSKHWSTLLKFKLSPLLKNLRIANHTFLLELRFRIGLLTTQRKIRPITS